MPSLLRRKSLDKIIQEHQAGLGDHTESLRRVLGVKDLTLLGVAAVIGAGIFSTIGKAAFDGGPGVIFLFIITAVTCGFTALCYAEFASRVPVAGSAYTYSYVTFGELVAWIIGWALILEYSIGNVVVAISWSAYFNNILHAFHIDLPDYLTIGYNTAKMSFDEAAKNHLAPTGAGLIYTHAPRIAGWPFIINLPAFIVICLITALAYIGIKESKKSANFMVTLKLVILAVIAVVGVYVIFSNNSFSNWSPFLPNGMTGVLKGVSAVFYAYIGFDAISTTAEECGNPQRDLPRGMIYSLVICTAIYIIITLVITGMVHYSEFQGKTDPLAFVFDKINMHKLGFVISIGAVIAATSVLIVYQIGQPRIWMSMSRDGLLPKPFGRVHPRFQTPSFSTIITGLLVAIPVLVVDDGLMTDLTSIGTLFAFVLVCGGVLALPMVAKQPGRFSLPYINGQWIIPVLFVLFAVLFRERITDDVTHLGTEGHEEILFLVFILISAIIAVQSFVKRYSLIPVLGMLCCMYLMIEIPVKSWMVFFGWMAVGLVVYFLYGFRNSKLNL
ncbi:amino acid permease [Dinghuibacter silviterrae]|uniref:Amino acid/polyamine/organocation transporter (APC superfamily) n=1 Tax=Dinghuibacter silviterrae TaxID=1539049 RepID=A0A4R8DJ30_9BACT|nr:amino acid permease [Dinghuibacter silviterrae]TDW97567.1 amino acid/polyamine/organocation transporter (APC superfamily) [Dinghuibacter silviterrae]